MVARSLVCLAMTVCAATFASRAQCVVYKGFDGNVVNKNRKKIQEMYDQALAEGRLHKGDTWSGNAMNPYVEKWKH